MSDEQKWITGIQQGDKDLFDEMARALYPRLLEFACSYTHSWTVAQDVVQEVLMRLWERHASWKPHSSARAYLFAAVRNRALNEQRDHPVSRNFPLSSILDQPSDEAPPGTTAELADLSLSYRIAVREMPERRRKVFQLSRVYGLSYDEIATVLGISINTVRTQMKDALKHVRAALEDFL